MNLLAHAYLSQRHPGILLGNMIGDDVKGMQLQLYPPTVRAGIQLHRFIDSFTDTHPFINEAKIIYRKSAGLYGGPLMDITLDYFLANDPGVYSADQWQSFASWAYHSLRAQSSWHVGGFRRYFPYLQKENWFIHYGEPEFIKNALSNLLKRVGLADRQSAVIAAFEQNTAYISDIYQSFFPALQAYCDQKATELLDANL